MGLFGWNQKPGTRRVPQKKPGQKVEFSPSVVYRPTGKKRIKRSSTGMRRQINWQPYVAAVAGLLLVLGIIYGLISVSRAPELNVKNIRLLGNRTINDAQVMAALDDFRGQNLLMLNANEVEKKLLTEFSIFNGVAVAKYFPDTLYIKMSEREPKLVYVNLSGAFLLDSGGRVLQQIFLDPVVYPDEKLNIARGYGDPESQYLYEIFLSEFKTKNQLLDLSAEEQAVILARDFNYDMITLEERQAKLRELEVQYREELFATWDKQNQAVDISVYSTYPRVNALEAEVISANENVDLERLDLSSELLRLFASRRIRINRMIWEGELLVKVVTTEDKNLIFGMERKITEQFEDFLLVDTQLKKEGKEYCQIDVTGNKVAVRLCK